MLFSAFCVMSRKLPFLALSLFCPPPGAVPLPLSTFLAALALAATRVQQDRATASSVFSHI